MASMMVLVDRGGRELPVQADQPWHASPCRLRKHWNCTDDVVPVSPSIFNPRLIC
jgi:hypothetical protein